MGLIQLLRSLLKLEVGIKQHRFSRGGELKGHTFTATMASRKDIAFTKHGVMGQAVLIMENAVKTGGWSCLAGMECGVDFQVTRFPIV